MTAVQRLVVGAAAAVALAFAAAVLVLPAIGSSAVGAVSNWTQVVVPVLTAAVCLDGARRQRDRSQRRAWVLYGAGAASWGAGQCVFTWYELVARVSVPVPSAADPAFLLYPLLGTAAIWLLPGVPRSRTVNVRALLDGLVVASSLVFVAWALSLRLLWGAGDGDVAGLVVTTTYVVTDVVLLTMVTLLLPEVGRARRRVLLPVALGTACFAVADIGYVFATSTTTYMSGEVFDVGWVWGFLGVAVAAVLAHPVDGDGPGYQARVAAGLPSWGSILLPYGPVVAASAVLLWRLGSGTPWTGAESGLVGAVIVLVLVRQLVALADNRSLLAEVSRQHAQARHDALHDALTGLANRALFLDRVGHALDRADRAGGRTTVLFCDLDGFKQVNDVHGHAAGDAVLVEVARRLSQQVRTVDCVARLGGDEFAVLLEDPGDPETVVARIEGAMTVPVQIGAAEVRVRASIGVAQADGAGEGTDQLVSDADHAMYAIKQSRRGGVGDGAETGSARLPHQAGAAGLPGSRPATAG